MNLCFFIKSWYTRIRYIIFIIKLRKGQSMKRSAFIATVALFVAAVGVVIALASYFKSRSSYLYDDDDDFMFDDSDDLEYYSSDLHDGDAPEEDISEYPPESN